MNMSGNSLATLWKILKEAVSKSLRKMETHLIAKTKQDPLISTPIQQIHKYLGRGELQVSIVKTLHKSLEAKSMDKWYL